MENLGILEKIDTETAKTYSSYKKTTAAIIKKRIVVIYSKKRYCSYFMDVTTLVLKSYGFKVKKKKGKYRKKRRRE